MKRCPYCYTQIGDNSQFCPSCGKPMPSPKRKLSFEFEEEKSSLKAVLIFVAVIVVVVNLLGLALSFYLDSLSEDEDETEEATAYYDAGTETGHEDVGQTASMGDYSDGSHDDSFNDNTASQDYDWLEGHWVCDSPMGRIHLLIQDGHICQYRNSPSESDNLPYDIKDGRIDAHFDNGLDISYDIDEENKRIGMGSGYYAQKVGSASATTSSAYDTDSSTRFQSADDVYGYLANQRFRERSQGIELRYDGSCQLYINGEWNAPPFHVVNLQSKQAIINYNSPSDGSMRLIVRVVGRDIEVQDPIDGTVYYQVKLR